MLNNNFSELVKKYEHYRNKQRNKKFLSLLTLAAIIAGGFFLVFNSKFIVNSFKKTSPEEPVQAQVIKQEPAEITTPVPEVVEPKVIKTPEKKPDRVKVATPKEDKLPNKVYKREEKKIQKATPFELEVKERKNLYNLLKRNKENDNYQTTVNLAQFYFNEKNYEQAVTWSVKASKKDPKKSLPWVIYAKSKSQLGKTIVAKKALSIYLKHTESKEVRNLLDTLK
jgi:tetratricopeptide (TPR) repeat protein